jgi:thiosulfate dehydrogenase [quinone] large subunit
MKKYTKWSLLLLRVSLGWVMLYAGVTKIMNPEWTSIGYLENAQTFTNFFQWFATPENIGWVNFVNEWGLTLLGVSLILGIGVRLSSFLGVLLMMLYYFPILNFPHPDIHSYIIDDHVIYALILLYFGFARVGRIYGLDSKYGKYLWS